MPTEGQEKLSLLWKGGNKTAYIKNASIRKHFFNSREEGIRTLDALLEHTHFPGVRLRPLGHLSNL